MGRECGPKLSKAEFIGMNTNTTRQDPPRTISSIAKDLETRFPDMEATEIYGLINQRLRNPERE